MNCKTCQSELEKYLEETLPEDTKLQVKEHLEICIECSENLLQLRRAYKVIDEEKEYESNPFIATRIMTAIGELEQKQTRTAFYSLSGKILKPALVTLMISGALLLGIITGNLGRKSALSSQIPEEIAYINDSEIESLDLFLTE